MSECTDKKYRDMLHAYELGLLTDEEREEYELHILDCPSCREEILQFQAVAKTLNSSSDTSKAIEKMVGSDVDNSEAIKPVSKITRLFVPIAIAAAILIFLLIKPWDIQISPTKEAMATENRLAILYFENMADSADSLKLGKIAANLLITDLSESNYINVLSNERIYDLIDYLTRNDSAKSQSELSFEIADMSKSRWLLTGTILQTEPNLVITSQLVSYPSGNIIASQKVVGNQGEDIFAAIDQLSKQIKNDMSLPAEAFKEPDRNIAEYTTHSEKAYYYYMQGLESYFKFYPNIACGYFEKAIEEDSTFAMAYYYLASITDSKLIYKAMEYSDRASKLGKFYIEIYEAALTGNKERHTYLLNSLIKSYPDEKNAYLLLATDAQGDADYDQAIKYLLKTIEIDPFYTRAINLLAYNYAATKNYDSAITYISRYIELAPDEANPYDSKGDIMSEFGEIDSAIVAYKTALQIKNDFNHSIMRLGFMYLFKGQYDQAEEYLDKIISNQYTSYRITALMARAYIPVFQGQLQKAIDYLKNIIATADNIYPSYHFLLGQIYWLMEDWPEAVEQIEKAIRVNMMVNPTEKGMYFRPQYIKILAEMGNIDKAEEMTEEIGVYYRNENRFADSYYFSKGVVAMAREDFETALTYFDSVAIPDKLLYGDQCLIGVAHLKAGQLDSAIEIFERQSKILSASRAYFGTWSIKVYYYLGLAYEEKEEYSLAAKNYERFIGYWGESDFPIKEVEAARSNLNRIKNHP